VVLTAGTFLDGRSTSAWTTTGRPRGRPAGRQLSARLKELKLPQGRLKTGTPPRIDGRSIDFSRAGAARRRHGPVPVFSFMGGGHAPAPAAVLDHAHQRAHARHHPQRL
jgi:tRNA uridine 5-carboxymethylaminomethyl modification enzyme